MRYVYHIRYSYHRLRSRIAYELSNYFGQQASQHWTKAERVCLAELNHNRQQKEISE